PGGRATSSGRSRCHRKKGRATSSKPPAGPQNAKRQSRALADRPASAEARKPPSAKLEHHKPRTRPRSRCEKNSPRFLVKGAHPAACHSPCSASRTANCSSVDEAPVSSAVATERSMPSRTTRRVPKRSPHAPQKNCP